MTVWAYGYTGVAQTFTAPTTGYYWVTMWGAGGGAGRYTSAGGNTSGAGAAVYFLIFLNSGETLSIEVGEGGKPGVNSPSSAGGDGGWPDGGWGARGDVQCGGGGGSTRIWRSGNLEAVAGGGAGGTYSAATLSGGAGGWPEGQGSGRDTGGTGGTQTAGGFDRNDPTSVAKTGGYLQGARGTNAVDRFTSTSDDGSGGGGGYYGGGGGGGDGVTGGGGSSYTSSACEDVFHYSGYFGTPGYTFSPYYIAGIAIGVPVVSTATGGAQGGNGRVVISDQPYEDTRYVSKTVGYTPLINNRFSVDKASAYVALQRLTADVSSLGSYAVLRPPKPEVQVPKATAYVLLDGAAPEDAETMVTMSVAYAVVFDDPNKYAYLTKSAAYAILRGELRIPMAVNYTVLNDPYPRFVEVPKLTGYAIMGPATGRITKATGYAILDDTPKPEQRITMANSYAVLDILFPRVFATDFGTESLTRGTPQVRATDMGIEVTRKGYQPDLRLSEILIESIITGYRPDIRLPIIGVEVVSRAPEEPYMIDPLTHLFPSQTDLPGLAFNVKKAPSFSTRVAGNTSGREVRNSFWDDPRWDFNLTYELLRDYPVHQVESELKKIAGFFMQRRGKFEAWLFRDTDDFRTVSVQGLTNGTNPVFPLYRNFGGFNERIGQIDLVQPRTFWFRVAAEGEGHTVPATPGPYTVTASRAPQYRADVRVTLATGEPLARVDINPGPMQYIVNPATGVYSFNAAQQGAAIKLFYDFNIPSADYEIVMPNKLVFDVAPVAGLELWGDFQFYFVCRFDEDSHEYEKFMDKLWELQQCTFKSIIQ